MLWQLIGAAAWSEAGDHVCWRGAVLPCHAYVTLVQQFTVALPAPFMLLLSCCSCKSASRQYDAWFMVGLMMGP